MFNAYQPQNRGQVPQRIYPLAGSRGNTVAEYTLVGVLLVVVCVVGLQALSSGLNSAVAMIRQDMKNHQQQAAVTLAAQKSASAAGLSSGSPLTDAQKAILEESLSQKIETTGANGATELLANQIAQAAALLFSQGKIDQSQYNILMQLANQGHQMAQVQDMISQAMKLSNGSFDQFANTTYHFNGQTYTALELTHLIGFQGPTPETFGTTNVLTASSTAEPVVAQFLSVYNQALASGALSDPTLKATVDSASVQIAGLGEITENLMQGMVAGEYGTDSGVVTTKEASMATTESSAQICTAGSFQDNGVLCKP